MSKDILINETTATFVTAALLTEIKRQYYELDLLNEVSGERWVFMIPIGIFNMTIMNKSVIKPQVIKVKDREPNNKQPPSMSI